MKKIGRFLTVASIGLVAALGVAVAVVAWVALEEQPLVDSVGHLDAASVRRARAILAEHDPRYSQERVVRDVDLRGEDVELALSYAAAKFVNGAVNLRVVPDRMSVQATIPLKHERFANVDVTFKQTDRIPEIVSFEIGGLTVPAAFAQWFFKVAQRQSPELDDGTSFVSLIHSVTFSENHLSVSYEWRNNLLDQVRASVMTEVDRQRIQFYHSALVAVSARLRRNESISELLRPLFAQALKRSETHSPVAENRAALIVISAYASGRGLMQLIPDAKDWPSASPRGLRLHGRRDLAQHFLVSAGLAALGGGALADAMGLFKEIDDSRFGSGFSFTDLAADRGGRKFGELALESTVSARRLQRWVALGLSDEAFLPHPKDLPEYLSEDEFKQHFGYVDSPSYKKLLSQIDAAIEARALYRDPPS